MSRQLKRALLLSLLCFLGISIGSLYQQEHQAWQKWQVKDFRNQQELLEERLKQTGNPVERAGLEKSLADLKIKKPEIKILTLPNGKQELCLTCHLGIEEISPSHPAESFGCTVCHGGTALSLDEETAHRGMYGAGHPGWLDVSQLSCGSGESGIQCHSGHERQADNQVDLMKTSLMAGKGGELSMLRYMFGLDLIPKLIVKPGQTAADIPHPFDQKLQEPAVRQNCLVACHQSNGQIISSASQFSPSPHPSTSSHPSSSSSTSSSTSTSTSTSSLSSASSETLFPQLTAEGCESCHVLTNPSHTYTGGDVTIPRDEQGHGAVHRLTTQIPYTQCNQCHNVGLPDLYKMSFNLRPDLQAVQSTPPVDADDYEVRLHNVYQPGMVFTQCEVKLDCIDCHTRQEVMGDGHVYSSEYDALKLQCLDCHGTQKEKPLAWTIKSMDDLAFEEKIVNPVFPPLNVGDEILVTQTGEELPWVRKENGAWFLYQKANGRKYEIPLVSGSQCRQEANKQTSNDCHKCHDVSGNLNLHRSP